MRAAMGLACFGSDAAMNGPRVSDHGRSRARQSLRQRGVETTIFGHAMELLLTQPSPVRVMLRFMPDRELAQPVV